ncbi:MAG: T9SS type A sorting domain-containing protein [Bacteroidota bacterium]|nr:T9SS type A sorting domain-containing protein [Bacteroidota bacterium]
MKNKKTLRKIKIIIIIYLTISSVIDVNAQCPSTKYGIVPVWPQGWSYTDKENWYQMMSDKGMGYSHSILTWPELKNIQSNRQLSSYINYIAHLKNEYNFKYHLLIRNPSTTVNPVPAAYTGLNFEDPVLTNAFYNFATEIIDSFAGVLDYLTIGGESDIYFNAYPNEIDEYVNLLSDIATYVDDNYPSTKFATVLTFEHGIQSNDTLWQLTKSFSDMLAITYWPLNSNFTIIPTAVTDIQNNITDLLIAADGKPVIIKESGLPSSTLLNSSETIQAQFVEELFRQTININQIEIVGWDFLADYDKATVDYWVNFQQIYTPEFRAYIETIGLMDTLSNQKPAYNTYLQMLDTICSQTTLNQIEQSNNITIYPNPVNNIINIEYDKEFIMEIFDVTGKKVLTSNLRQLNISVLKSGTYIVLIKSKDGVLMKLEKMIKE